MKILNPLTGRLVNSHGRIGRKIVQVGGSPDHQMTDESLDHQMTDHQIIRRLANRAKKQRQKATKAAQTKAAVSAAASAAQAQAAQQHQSKIDYLLDRMHELSSFLTVVHPDTDRYQEIQDELQELRDAYDRLTHWDDPDEQKKTMYLKSLDESAAGAASWDW